MKLYSKCLPRKIIQDDRTPICQHLEDDGSSCDRFAIVEATSFEENGNFWHISTFCEEHGKLRNFTIPTTPYA